MSERDGVMGEARGLSAGQLVLMFLGGVAVCALFFSAGFLVGYNERLSKAAPVTEQVNSPSDIPPLVNQPAQSSASQPRSDRGQAAAPQKASGTEQPVAPPEAATTLVTHPEPQRPQPLSSSQPPRPAPPPARPVSTDAAAKASSRSRFEPAAPNKPSGKQSGGLLIQVAATGNKHDADKIFAALKALAYPVMMVTPELANAGDNLYRVQVGPFSTRESAERIREKLIQDGFKSPFIKH